LQAQQWPAQDLPHLSGDQKAVASRLGIPEEDYARSALAGNLSRCELSAKTERFGEIFQKAMRERRPDALIHTIELQTFEGKLRIVAFAGDREVRLQIDEDLADNVLSTGSKELEARLARIVELNLPSAGAARAS
jgi:hypothetical protein